MALTPFPLLLFRHLSGAFTVTPGSTSLPHSKPGCTRPALHLHLEWGGSITFGTRTHTETHTPHALAHPLPTKVRGLRPIPATGVPALCRVGLTLGWGCPRSPSCPGWPGVETSLFWPLPWGSHFHKSPKAPVGVGVLGRKLGCRVALMVANLEALVVIHSDPWGSTSPLAFTLCPDYRFSPPPRPGGHPGFRTPHLSTHTYTYTSSVGPAILGPATNRRMWRGSCLLGSGP